MAWRLAKSLEKLRSQVNAKHPKRSKASDGAIGDEKVFVVSVRDEAFVLSLFANPFAGRSPRNAEQSLAKRLDGQDHAADPFVGSLRPPR